MDVEGEDGGIVLFLVECLQGGAWVRATELRATVSDGAARATLRLEHPGRADPGGGARRAHYRFSARLG